MIKSLNNDPVHALLSPANVLVYQVPKYQRECSWGKEEWEVLFEDLLEHDGSDGHFLGAWV